MIGFSLGPARLAMALAAAAGGSSFTFVGAGAVTTIFTGTSLVLPLSEPAQAGDLIVFSVSSAVALTTPPGTAINAGAPSTRFVLATAGQTSVSLTLNAANQTATGIAATFRPTSVPTLAANNSVAANPATIPSLAVANLPALVAIAGNHNANTATAWTATLPAGAVQVASVPGNVLGTVRALYFAYVIQTAGTTTGAITLSSAPTAVRATAGVFRLT